MASSLPRRLAAALVVSLLGARGASAEPAGPASSAAATPSVRAAPTPSTPASTRWVQGGALLAGGGYLGPLAWVLVLRLQLAMMDSGDNRGKADPPPKPSLAPLLIPVAGPVLYDRQPGGQIDAPVLAYAAARAQVVGLAMMLYGALDAAGPSAAERVRERQASWGLAPAVTPTLVGAAVAGAF